MPAKPQRPITTTKLWTSTVRLAKILAAEKGVTIREIMQEALEVLQLFNIGTRHFKADVVKHDKGDMV